MHQQRNKPSSTMNNHSNIVSQKESNSCPMTKLKVMENCDLNDREFKIVTKKLNEIQENLKRQFIKLINKRSILPKRLKL